MSDHLIRAMLSSTGPRAIAAVTTTTCREAARRHRLTGHAAEALGRALTASALMSTLTKGQERTVIRIAGSGPLAALTAEADAQGMLRGYPTWRRQVDEHVEAVVPEGNGPSVSFMVGNRGSITVIRDLGLKELYQGESPILTGDVDTDLEHYLNHSEQLPSVLRCRARLANDGRIATAAGVLLQHMPEAPEALDRDRNALDQGGLDRFLTEDPTRLRAEDLLHAVSEIQPPVLEWRQIRFRCPCSRSRARGALLLTTTEDIDALMAEGRADVTCHFCNHTWSFSVEELSDLRREIQDRPDVAPDRGFD